MTKQLKTTSNKITACPECDSGSLYTNGSEVECLSCGWKHVAKKPRTAKKVVDHGPSNKLIADMLAKENLLPPAPNLAEQLQAAVTSAPKARAEAKVKSAPSMVLAFAKEFKPRTNKLESEDKGNFSQIANWEALTAALQSHGGHLTYAEAVQAVADAAKAKGYEATCNARGFVQGRVRNGHLKAVS